MATSAPEIPLSLQFQDNHIAPDGQLVREQLERILASPQFRNSKRYAAVLKYIVEQSLAGNADRLKERTIGVDVFGREPDYDTASDHVVRSAMAEVRKRLSNYYQEASQRDEIQLELQPGCYVPQFRSEPRPLRAKPVPPPATARPAKHWMAAGIACLLVACTLLLIRFLNLTDHSLDKFWGPVLVSPGQVMLCIGNLEGGTSPGFNESPVDLRTLSMGDFHRLPSQTIHVSDAIVLAKFSGFLQARKKRWRIIPQSEANYGDLRNGPAILIGLMNNNWTERLVGKLRYRAEKTAAHKVLIRDTRNPRKDDWSMDYSTPLLSVTRDYALVLRIFDPNTGQTVITAAGISVFGTLAAAEFLTDPDELRSLDTLTPGWKNKNLEIVLSTEVVRAKSGRPQIVATEVW